MAAIEKWFSTWFACALCLGCGQVAAEPDNESTDQELSSSGSSDPVRAWNELALDTVRRVRASDADAARTYAMLNVAIYDAVNGILSRGAAGRDFALVPPAGAPRQGNLDAAAAGAAHAVLSSLFPAEAARYDSELANEIEELGSGSRVSAGQKWGASVGAQVVTARSTDGSSPVESQPAGTGPGKFRASWSGVQYRNMKPFAIADASVYVGDGPPPLDSLAYAAAFAEVKLLGNAAIPNQQYLDTFNYWSLAAGTVQPPGEWIKIGLNVSSNLPQPLPEKARLFALLSMALADTVPPTVMTKFTFQHWRPATAIREADTDGNAFTDPDPTWAPRAGGIGSSPEYWSGHSSFSAAGASALAGFFCRDAIAFTHVSDSAPGGLPRSYPSFSAAAAEAGRSRVLGGIHFDGDGNQDGLKAGRAIAAEVLSKKLLRKSGPTHFGECPL